ncbi:MAG: LPS export ABC transporter permease LptF [Rickettsiales bacterium]|nr:LPS export ABC transporter permease LptF [Rickettsiales bacterium]
MKLHSRYIFQKLLIGFIACISILIALIWFSRALTFVKYVTENGVAINQFFYLFLLILPWLLIFIIPISLLISILIIFNRLIMSNEITILKNAGLTKLSIAKPVIILTTICCVICLIISFYLMPYANKKLRLSKVDLYNNYANLSINPQTFENLKSMTIYVKQRDEKNNLSGILLHDERAKEYSSTITAKSGRIVAQNNSALLYMENGSVQKFNYANQKSEILHFDDYVFNLTQNDNNNEQIHWKPKERYLNELINPDSSASAYDLEKFRGELHQRLTYPFLPIIFAIGALSCIMRGSFNRKGNSYNVFLAVLFSTAFLVITFSIYNLIESSAKYILPLYLNFILFFAAGFYLLKENNHKNKPLSLWDTATRHKPRPTLVENPARMLKVHTGKNKSNR